MRSRSWLWGVAVAVIALVGYAVITVRGPAAPGDELKDRPECGHSGDLVDTSFAETSEIPEYNDCQRFVVIESGERKYDSLYAIFVSKVAPRITSVLGPPLPAVAPVTGGGTVITAGPPPAPVSPPPVPQAPPTATAITIAMVKGDGDYPTLGIVRGMNCLYVWYYTVGGATLWSAKMVLADNNLCPQRTAADLDPLPGKVLEVYREEVTDPVTNEKFARADYPEVARWDWDSDSSKQYVSIVCDVAWCEIGAQGFKRSPPLPLDGTKTIGDRRVRLIKGWFDQQHLAKGQASGMVTPSDLLGTIIPDPDLGNKNSTTNFKRWTNVAYIVAEPTTASGNETLEQYDTKLGFRKATFKKPLRVQMRYKTTWLARVQHQIIGPIYGSKNNRVKYRDTGATGYLVPGTARWRWKDVDEGTWTRCTQGCCEMSD